MTWPQPHSAHQRVLLYACALPCVAGRAGDGAAGAAAAIIGGGVVLRHPTTTTAAAAVACPLPSQWRTPTRCRATNLPATRLGGRARVCQPAMTVYADSLAACASIAANTTDVSALE